MNPFKLSPDSSKLIDHYIQPDLLYSVFHRLSDIEKRGIAAQWLSEGIPFAFRECPLLFENIRYWFSYEIGVSPKEIVLIGSARTGFKMDKEKYGVPFGKRSDMDFAIISLDLFQKMVETIDLWREEYGNGTKKPKNETEKGFWDENINRILPKTIKRGFINLDKVSFNYKIPCLVKHSMWCLNERLKKTQGAPQVTKMSAFIYKDHESFLARMLSYMSEVIPKCR
jgi:hypothetical protein